MANHIQLDFLENDPLHFHEEEIKLINEKLNNLRRGLFKRHTELSKLFLQLKESQDRIESRLYAIESALKKNGSHIEYDGTLGFQIN